MDCFQHFSLCYLPYPDCHWERKKKKVRVLPLSSLPFFGFQVTHTKYDIRSPPHQPKVNNFIKTETENNLSFLLFGVAISCRISCQCRHLLRSDPKQLLGVWMHYLNDPLCFSQSQRLQTTYKSYMPPLLYPVRSDTHCIFKTCIKTPTLFLPFPVPFAAAIQTQALFINHQIIIQIDKIVICK